MRLNLKFKTGTWKSEWLWYILLYTLMTLYFVNKIYLHSGCIEWFDSKSYISAADRVINGMPDMFRTPVYPLLIGLFERLLGAEWRIGIITLQYVGVIVSALALRVLALKYIRNRKIAFAVTAIYLLMPYTSIYILCIMTESLAVSGIILLMYFMLRPLPGTPGVGNALASTILLLFLVFLRPIFISLFPVCIGYYLFLLWRNRKGGHKAGIITVLAGLVTVGGLVFAYNRQITRIYGIKSLSTVTTINKYHILRQAGYLCPDNCRNPEMAEMMRGFIPPKKPFETSEIVREMTLLEGNFGIPEIEYYVDTTISKNLVGFATHIICNNFITNSSAKMFPGYGSDRSYNFYPPFLLYWLIMAIICFLAVRQWRAKRKLSPESAILFLLSLSIVVTAFSGAQDDWQRLSYPGIPAFMLLTGKLVCLFDVRRNKRFL